QLSYIILRFHSSTPFYLDLYFFFSSRRRHTRFSRDWSSDVCSSDLFDLVRIHKFGERDETAAPGTPTNRLPSYTAMVEFAQKDRSEERRVGREGKLRGAP